VLSIYNTLNPAMPAVRLELTGELYMNGEQLQALLRVLGESPIGKVAIARFGLTDRAVRVSDTLGGGLARDVSNTCPTT